MKTKKKKKKKNQQSTATPQSAQLLPSCRSSNKGSNVVESDLLITSSFCSRIVSGFERVRRFRVLSASVCVHEQDEYTEDGRPYCSHASWPKIAIRRGAMTDMYDGAERRTKRTSSTSHGKSKLRRLVPPRWISFRNHPFPVSLANSHK